MLLPLCKAFPNQYIVNFIMFSQPLTEMSTRKIKIIMFLGSKVQRVRRADNLSTIYELIV
jgi:hypothetical protein